MTMAKNYTALNKEYTRRKYSFYFPQKSGLYGIYMVLCCATGGNKNERYKRIMARKHSTRGRLQNAVSRNEATNGIHGSSSQRLAEQHDRRAKSNP